MYGSLAKNGVHICAQAVPHFEQYSCTVKSEGCVAITIQTKGALQASQTSLSNHMTKLYLVTTHGGNEMQRNNFEGCGECIYCLQISCGKRY